MEKLCKKVLAIVFSVVLSLSACTCVLAGEVSTCNIEANTTEFGPFACVRDTVPVNDTLKMVTTLDQEITMMCLTYRGEDAESTGGVIKLTEAHQCLPNEGIVKCDIVSESLDTLDDPGSNFMPYVYPTNLTGVKAIELTVTGDDDMEFRTGKIYFGTQSKECLPPIPLL